MLKNYSSRREAVRRVLESVDTHPTAAEVYTMVRQVLPGISLGTVYRNLSQLADDGMILRLSAGDGAERYDGNAKNHYHLACSECGVVSDIDMSAVLGLDEMCEGVSGAKITRHTLIFHGVCADCLGRKS